MNFILDVLARAFATIAFVVLAAMLIAYLNRNPLPDLTVPPPLSKRSALA